MKTALDWLIEQMPYEFRANHTQELFKQAKELEKEQIIETFENGVYHARYFREDEEQLDGEDYYNQTYNQNK
jgi:hypothetical protein